MNTKHNTKHNTKPNKKQNKGLRKTQKINCSPVVAGKTSNKDTCFTPIVLDRIKMEYNKDHVNDKINATNPNEIWHELHNKLTSCPKEDCWLNQIDDTVLRNKINEHIFAPKQPPNWKKDPNEWLTNYNIFDVLKQYEDAYPEFEFIGPSFIDFDKRINNNECVTTELCNFSLNHYVSKNKFKIGITFNLDEHTQSGSHWVSMFIDIKEKFIFYFDSGGNLSIPKQIKALVTRIINEGKKMSPPIHLKFFENYPLEHQLGDTECGMYSLFFIITMLTNKVEDKVLNYRQKINMFTKKRIPDKYVEKYRNIYFNK